MSSERLFLWDPKEKQHQQFLKNTLQDVHDEGLLGFLKELPNYSKDDSGDNETTDIFILEEKEKIKDCCVIKAEKDIKTCMVSLMPSLFKGNNREIIISATNYAFNRLGMQQVLVSTSLEDQNGKKFLEDNGYESLGEQDGNYLFLKEPEEKKEQRGKIA